MGPARAVGSGRRVPIRVCFFAPVRSRATLERIGFYAQDINALEAAGCNVTIATRWSEIPWGADVYFIWWWTWAFVPLIKARLSRRPSVITGTFDFGDHGPHSYNQRPFYQQLIHRIALRLATTNLFVSRYEFERVTRSFRTSGPRYSPHTVDTDRYCPTTDRRDENLVCTIAWLERLNVERKCLFEIVRAMPLILAQAPQARFAIAGAWEDGQAPLSELAKRLGVAHAIEWLGVIDEAKKIRLLQSCSVYLQPSRFEGFGLAILEAMSCGAPVITSPVGAVPEVVGDCASFVNGQSSEDIAAAVVALLGDGAGSDEIRRRRAEGRRRAVECFGSARRQRDIAEVIEELVLHDLDEPGGSRPPA